VQDYTLSEAFAPTQTFDIPAFGGKLDVSWNPESQVTQWGGLAYFVSYLKTSGLFDRRVEDAPFHYTSPNAPEVRDVVGTAILAIICGFTRYTHINRPRNDVVLPMLLGLRKIVSEDSVRRALKAANKQELKPCRAIARLIAIVANWWNIFCRLADGDRHLEPTTSRPMYMGIVGRLVVSGRKRLKKNKSATKNRSRSKGSGR
jgi:hypothetical protein